MLGPSRSWKKSLLLVAGGCFLIACTAEGPKKRRSTPVEPGEDWYADSNSELEQTLEPELINNESGAFGAGERPAAGPGTSPPGGTDASRECGRAVAIGDLAIVELMIASRSGSADFGEWVEIKNTASCSLRLRGLVIESPRGQAAPNAVTIEEDFLLGAKRTFVVANSLDPAKNGGLPGKVFAWGFSDVLKNAGDTINVRMGNVLVDTLTYPAFTNLSAGRALAFPSNCGAGDRASWARWSLTFDEFAPGYKGTPNAPNDDVVCF